MTARPSEVPVHDAPARRRVLLATEYGPVSDAASEEAIKIATRLQGDLLAVSVVDPGELRLPGGRFGSRVDQVRGRFEVAAQAFVEHARASGVEASYLIWEGDPADTILAAAEAEGADLIVMGSHHRGMVGRLLFGSVSQRVGREARCPVIVVSPHCEDQEGPAPD